jgi:hypothetical protein
VDDVRPRDNTPRTTPGTIPFAFDSANLPPQFQPVRNNVAQSAEAANLFMRGTPGRGAARVDLNARPSYPQHRGRRVTASDDV